MTWLLYIVLVMGDGEIIERFLPMEDEETCVTHLVSARIVGKASAAIMVCTQKVLREQTVFEAITTNPAMVDLPKGR